MTLRLAWYGDDFTGATDTLRVAAEAGLRSLLFMDIPNDAQLASAGPLDALGIAGAARTMSPSQMETELTRVGQFFRHINTPVIHYKCCSTFDSSPAIGSIGIAAQVLGTWVDNPLIIMIGGQPDIGRYCCFGNLYASAGAGGQVYRLDRHPTMSRHPVTPMAEADVRRPRARQGLTTIDSIGYPEYWKAEALDCIVNAPAESKSEKRYLLFDVADTAHLAPAGRQIDRQSRHGPLLTIGSSVVVQALAAWWSQVACREGVAPEDMVASPGVEARDGPIFVLAGSMSPVTARQVSEADSYHRIPLCAVRLLGEPQYVETQLARIARMLHAHRHVLAYVENGDRLAVDPAQLALATAGLIRRVVVTQADNGSPLRRLGVAGGDTSSLAAKALDIWALSYADVLGPGVTLCRAHSDDARLDGLQIMLKGGQMGGDDIFERLLRA